MHKWQTVDSLFSQLGSVILQAGLLAGIFHFQQTNADLVFFKGIWQ